MDALLSGKTCIVTGGSRGIGFAIVELFARQGGRVYYLSRSEAPDPGLLSAAAAEGAGSVRWLACDLTDEAAIQSAIDAVAAEAGAIDALVNNAGIARDGLALRMSLGDWDAVLKTNLTSAFLASRAAARHMIKRRSGSIVSMSSVVGLRGNGGQVNYAASKAGLVGFTKSLARELSSRNVRVNAIAPGFIDTAMTEKIPAAAREALKTSIPLGRSGRPEEIASAALFLCSDLSSYVTGEILKVDGGMGM